VIRVKQWPESVELLTKWHGRETRVGVVPDATIQYFPDQAS